MVRLRGLRDYRNCIGFGYQEQFDRKFVFAPLLGGGEGGEGAGEEGGEV